MIIAIVIVLALVAAIGYFAWQIQIERADMLAAQVRIAEIQAQSRIDYLDHLWPFFIVLSIVAIVLVGIVAYTIIVTKRPQPTINDHRQVYLMLPPGQSRRQALKQLGGNYEALPLAPGEPTKRLEKQPVKQLTGGDR